MFMKEMFMLFLSLTMGYVLCVLANKEKGTLRAVGYALGISVIAFTLIAGLASSCMNGKCMPKKFMCGMMEKPGMMKK